MFIDLLHAFLKNLLTITGQHHHHHHHHGHRHHRSHQLGGGGHHQRGGHGHPIEKEAHTVPAEHMVHVTSTASAMTTATSNLVATAATLVRKHSTSRDPSCSSTNTDHLTTYDHYYYSTSQNKPPWPQRPPQPQTASIWTVETAAANLHTRLRRNLTSTNSA